MNAKPGPGKQHQNDARVAAIYGLPLLFSQFSIANLIFNGTVRDYVFYFGIGEGHRNLNSRI